MNNKLKKTVKEKTTQVLVDNISNELLEKLSQTEEVQNLKDEVYNLLLSEILADDILEEKFNRSVTVGKFKFDPTIVKKVVAAMDKKLPPTAFDNNPDHYVAAQELILQEAHEQTKMSNELESQTKELKKISQFIDLNYFNNCSNEVLLGRMNKSSQETSIAIALIDNLFTYFSKIDSSKKKFILKETEQVYNFSFNKKYKNAKFQLSLDMNKESSLLSVNKFMFERDDFNFNLEYHKGFFKFIDVKKLLACIGFDINNTHETNKG